MFNRLNLDLLIISIICNGQAHLDPNWPIIIIAKFDFSDDFHWSIDICLAS